MPILLQLAQSYSNPDSVNYKIAYLREQIGDADFGKLAYEDQVQLAMLGETVIVGGFLRTELIAAKSIHAEHLDVEDLSAITGKFTSLMAGNPFGARLEMGESAGEPFLSTYDSGNKRRVSLGQDRVQFFDEIARNGGNIYSYVYDPGSLNLPAMSVHSPRYLLMIASPNYLPGWEENYLTNKHALVSLENLDRSGYPRARLMVWSGVMDTNPSVSVSPEGIELIGETTLSAPGSSAPTIRPSADTFGFIGTPSYRFYRGYAESWLTSSEKRLKTNIKMASKRQCYDQVKALKFKTYNLTSEVERAKTEEPGFKVTDYIGVIAEESPDIICDAEKKNINLYSYISLIGAAVQEMQDRLESIENILIKGK